MSHEAIHEEIKWQVEGREGDARLDPRRYAYRVLTVLGIELNLDVINAIEQDVIERAGVSMDDYDDDGDGNWDYPEDYDDPNRDDDKYSYAETAPALEEPPLSEDEEAELLTQYTDTELE